MCFKMKVTAVPSVQLILRLTVQLRYSLYRVVDTILSIEMRMKMLENSQIILDFPRQEIYYTHIDQLLLRAGQARTSVRRFG